MRLRNRNNAARARSVAREIAQRIEASAQRAWDENEHADPTRWEGFHQRQRALWDEADAAGVIEEVSTMIGTRS